MNILAFDFGTKTGWAWADKAKNTTLPPEITESGVQEFPLARGESTGMRWIRFRSWAQEILDRTKPDLVLYEQAHNRGGAATDLLVGMATRIQEFCSARGIEYHPVHSATLKKAMAGKGNADKAAMVKTAVALYGRGFVDDNEADAALLLEYGRRAYGR